MTTIDISTTYLGLKLQSPFIVASSELTDSVEKIEQHERNGAGAIVLKSIFEEQILAESYAAAFSNMDLYSDSFSYIQQYHKVNSTEKLLRLIETAKKNTRIPIIASINCISKSEWLHYTKAVETSGADALELNLFFFPSDIYVTGTEIEKKYLDIVDAVKKSIKIPISLKISTLFSSLPNMLYQFYILGVNGFVLFNRFYQPDINLHTSEPSVGNVFTEPNDYYHSLRCIGMFSDVIKSDFSASTGIHSAETAIKMLLAGAKAIEVASIIYKNGSEYISVMNNELKMWMSQNNHQSLTDFIGKCSLKNVKDGNAYSRIQFMKYFAKIK